MRNAYIEQLDNVLTDLVAMSRLVQQAVDRATHALLEADGEIAKQVIAGDEHIDLAIRVSPDLRAGRPVMDLRIGRVLELLRHPGAFRAQCRDDLFRALNGVLHAARALREHDDCAERQAGEPLCDLGVRHVVVASQAKRDEAAEQLRAVPVVQMEPSV